MLYLPKSKSYVAQGKFKLRIATKKGKIEDSLMMHNMTQLPEALFHLLHNFPFTLDLTFRFLHNFYNYPIIAKVMLQKVGSCFLTITFPKSYPGCGGLYKIITPCTNRESKVKVAILESRVDLLKAYSVKKFSYPGIRES